MFVTYVSNRNFYQCYLRLIPAENKFVADQAALEMVMGMGFTREQATKALKATDNNLERAVDWIFSHQTEIDAQETDGASSSGESFRDGSSRKSSSSSRPRVIVTRSLTFLQKEKSVFYKRT